MKTIKYIFEAVFIYSIFLIIKLVGIKIGKEDLFKYNIKFWILF